MRSQTFLTCAHVYVPESEMADYARAGVKNLVPVPDRVKGITATRNWILDNVKERRVVMLDDDLQLQGWTRLFAHHAKQKRMCEKDWLRESDKLFDITEQLRYRIWGVATHSSLRAIYPFKPFLFRSYVTASFMGILNDGRTRFDERFPVKEDYELTLRCIKQDGGIVAARYLYWQNTHWTDKGGCAAYRTQVMELQAIKLLASMYPGMIRRVTRGGSTYSVELDF